MISEELRSLMDEPLSAKNRRTVQATCPHEEIYSSSVTTDQGTFTTNFCLDCHKSFQSGENT